MARERRDKGDTDSRDNALVDFVVKIRRSACVVKGGRRFSFNALVVVGDKQGKVSFGYGKANEVPPAVEKAIKEGEAQARRAKKVQLKGNTLEFALGYSHPVLIEAPEGITFAVETPTKFSISGIDKQKVGQISANIRRLRRPDPYKGKGVRYEGEQIRRKVGKTGK